MLMAILLTLALFHREDNGMDILLQKDGDLFVSPSGDIVLSDSVAQKINIRLKWFEGEWRWNEDEGLPYFEELFVKNPDTDSFEGMIREKIFEVDEVTEVRNVSIVYDEESRKAYIQYTALTDFETIREEALIVCHME